MPTVLIIEDNPVSAVVLSQILQRSYNVVSTLDPEEAKGYCRDLKIDVIVADVLLGTPVSGTEIARALRQSCPDIPVLFVSGTPLEGWFASDFANIEALLPGRVDFLMKPFTAEALTVAVSRLLQHDYSDTDIRAAVAEAKSFRKTAGS